MSPFSKSGMSPFPRFRQTVILVDLVRSLRGGRQVSSIQDPSVQSYPVRGGLIPAERFDREDLDADHRATFFG